MRVFIAVNIDDKIRGAVGDLQEQLQKKTRAGKSELKWVSPELMHLTLKFLGDVDETQIVAVCNAVKEAAAACEPFDISIESLGYFGGRVAKVLWVGTGQGTGAIDKLQKKIARQLDQLGWPPEARKFFGHLTLCRIKGKNAGLELAGVSEDYKDFRAGVVSVDSVSVYQSQLTPKGPVYTVLGTYQLE